MQKVVEIHLKPQQSGNVAPVHVDQKVPSCIARRLATSCNRCDEPAWDFRLKTCRKKLGLMETSRRFRHCLNTRPVELKIPMYECGSRKPRHCLPEALTLASSCER